MLQALIRYQSVGIGKGLPLRANKICILWTLLLDLHIKHLLLATVLDRKAMGLDPEWLHLFLYFPIKEKQMHCRK